MKYNASVNIEIGVDADYQYIVTPNAQRVLGDLIASVNSGVHSFSVIGTYGTGKSSFVIALERGLLSQDKCFIKDPAVFFGVKSYEIINIVGAYSSLQSLLSDRLHCDGRNVLDELKDMCIKAEKNGQALVLVIDEFGKVLEHAAKNNPEEELYFMQLLCELINDHRRKALLLTTLHQNFSSYANKLTDGQRQEWQKVKGRFKEIVFTEPIEQLLYMASRQLSLPDENRCKEEQIEDLFNLAQQSKYISESFSIETAKHLNPLDPFAAICLTAAIQKYGQNERSLFSFLTTTGSFAILNFHPRANQTYSLAEVYDYVTYNFYSEITQPGLETSGWTALNVSIGRAENGIIPEEMIPDAIKIIKSIGTLSILGGAAGRLDYECLGSYCRSALGISEPEGIIRKLESAKIIRFATYKSQYILFDGTDIDIEAELMKASFVVPSPVLSVEELKDYVRAKVALASAAYYRTGTPRYFSFIVLNEAEPKIPEGDIDGFCQLIFPLDDGCEERVRELSSVNREANLFAVFRNADEIVKHLYEIKKLQYVIEKVAVDDLVARRELQHLQEYEKNCLNTAVNDYLFTGNGKVAWYFKGSQQTVNSRRDFNKLLSAICDDIYPLTPILRNELINRQKLSSAISLAKSNLLDAILEHPDQADLGMDPQTFPPEKAIYLTLLKQTGIHRQDEDGIFVFGEPSDSGIKDLWDACVGFIARTVDRPQKVTELIKMLRARPFKLKQGIIDFWVPIFLYVKQQDFALYGSGGQYVMNINREVFDLLWKQPGDFSIKAFNVDGVKLEFFRKYRQFLRQDEGENLKKDSFASTFKPFLYFYKSLNDYAKNTRKFSDPNVVKFRDALANAVDPEKVFFEQLPEALGYSGSLNSDEFIQDYLARIRAAVHSLNVCYSELISRIEAYLIEKLGLPESFEKYKVILDTRYKKVKRYLLAPKTRNFLERVLAPSDSAQEFIEKISNVVLDKQLYKMQDKEEELLLDNLLFLFNDLDRYADISAVAQEESRDTLYSVTLLNSKGLNKRPQTFRLPENQLSLAQKKHAELENLMTGDNNLDICILLGLLAEKLN